MGSSDSLHRFTLNFPSGYIKAYPCCVFILSAFTQRHIPEQRLGCILAGQPQIYHNPYPTRNDTRPPRVIYSSSTSFRPHSRLIRSSHSYIYLPLGIAGSVTTTHADGFTFFDYGLKFRLRPFRFHLAMDTLSLLATEPVRAYGLTGLKPARSAYCRVRNSDTVK